jgi:hypothetical protein
MCAHRLMPTHWRRIKGSVSIFRWRRGSRPPPNWASPPTPSTTGFASGRYPPGAAPADAGASPGMRPRRRSTGRRSLAPSGSNRSHRRAVWMPAAHPWRIETVAAPRASSARRLRSLAGPWTADRRGDGRRLGVPSAQPARSCRARPCRRPRLSLRCWPAAEGSRIGLPAIRERSARRRGRRRCGWPFPAPAGRGGLWTPRNRPGSSSMRGSAGRAVTVWPLGLRPCSHSPGARPPPPRNPYPGAA